MRPHLSRRRAILSALIALRPLRSTNPATVAALPLASSDRSDLSGRKMASPSGPLSFPSWRPGTAVLDRDPPSLCKAGEDGSPRLARDEAYASSVMKAWRDELARRPSRSVSSPLVYSCKGDGTSLHGHLFRPPYIYQPPAEGGSKEEYLPGIVLFHTGAGPQDVFLRWRADSLVNARETFGNRGCVVLIADVLGDADGWAWHDRERYGEVRKSVLVPDGRGEREKLTGRVRAATEAIKSQPGVDPSRIGALGFCLGGHPILELARMRDPAVKAMATFHGVFDGVRELSSAERGDGVSECSVLVCTGEDDPFVASEDLDAALKMFTDLGCKGEMMKFKGARHGFTNPAQDFNPSDAFAYNQDACGKAWSAALSLLKRI